jgi:hypothetical protein
MRIEFITVLYDGSVGVTWKRAIIAKSLTPGCWATDCLVP